MQSYEKYMRQCFELAKKGQGFVSPNPLVGCVVLDKDENVISTGYHHEYGGNHAERDALLKLKNDEARGGTLIVNLEPCSHFGKTPPCADFIVERGLKKVVIAMKDVNPVVAGNGIKKLKDNGIEVIEGVLKKQAEELNEIFIKNMTEKKVFVTLKIATTLDGKIATKNGSSKWITGEAARKKGKELRKIYDAVLTTSSTVIADNPKFDCKTKILLDRNLKCDFSTDYFKTGKIYVATTLNDLPVPPNNVEFIKYTDLKTLFETLFEKGIMSVFVEAGGTLNGAFIEENLVDKIYQFIAPKIIGDNFAKSAFDGRNITEIAQCKNFEIQSVETFAPDILVTMKAVNNG
ncbi:bifunctional diaminohydroxyphosphoribosylaminopyrimidine deaminase/5-amino-6-(5-phosphoribosylamino)uracil reductase RibD [bacterium]|nr:bifunctional diaminohydroxyphosphoribosylaminopyrimidine deaminase/5-amino-6-(5-phosphoribosylamino)uracil reductase RibD [bacterium]